MVDKGKVEKEEECVIIDIAVPADQNIKMKEIEKMEKYQELAREITKMWNKNWTDSSRCAWCYINTIQPISWAFKDRYIN